jgi:hypothetical protein
MSDINNLNFGSSEIEFNINSNTNIILCGTHNNRLECYFYNLNKNNNYPKKSFNNCVIIKCYRINNDVKFKMIYEGESNGNNVGSLCSKSLNLNNGCWDIVSFNNYFNNYSYNINIPNNTEIYLIRHAMGVHNKMNLLQKVTNINIDSPLHIDGTYQAERAGIFLKGYINNFYKNAHVIYTASHLIRTQQTIGIIMKMIGILESIYIVPCSHEIVYINNCDSSLLDLIPVASNIPNCTSNSGTCGQLLLNNMNNISINWDYYMDFYKSNKKCQETDIVNEIIKLYLKNDF